MEGTIAVNCGAHIRDGIKSVTQEGICPETMWPYTIQNFAVRPPYNSYVDALKNKVVSYHKVARTLSQMKGCLAQGYPFVFGFTIYSAFEGAGVAKSGVLNQ